MTIYERVEQMPLPAPGKDETIDEWRADLRADIVGVTDSAVTEMKERAIAAVRKVVTKHQQEAHDARQAIGTDPEYDENLAEGALLALEAIRALE